MAATPEEVGLSSAQLKKLEMVTKQHIDDGPVPGAVIASVTGSAFTFQADQSSAGFSSMRR